MEDIFAGIVAGILSFIAGWFAKREHEQTKQKLEKANNEILMRDAEDATEDIVKKSKEKDASVSNKEFVIWLEREKKRRS